MYEKKLIVDISHYLNMPMKSRNTTAFPQLEKQAVVYLEHFWMYAISKKLVKPDDFMYLLSHTMDKMAQYYETGSFGFKFRPFNYLNDLKNWNRPSLPELNTERRLAIKREQGYQMYTRRTMGTRFLSLNNATRSTINIPAQDCPKLAGTEVVVQYD